MVYYQKAFNCKDYEQISTEELLFSMGNNYVFEYSCDYCIKCGKCNKSNKPNN